MIPMAVERSRTGNHSATARVAAGEAAPFANAQQQPADDQHHHTVCQAVAGARQRPKHHDQGEAQARAHHVHQLSAAQVHEAIGDQESRVEGCHDLIGNRDVLLDRFNRYGQGLTVEVADRDGYADENGDLPAKFPNGDLLRKQVSGAGAGVGC